MKEFSYISFYNFVLVSLYLLVEIIENIRFNIQKSFQNICIYINLVNKMYSSDK